MKRLLSLLPALCFATLAHAAPPPAADGKLDVTLETGKVHEACVKLAAGDKRHYHWKADGPVDFNIHYHQGPEVFYPVKRDAMRGDGWAVKVDNRTVGFVGESVTVK